MPSRRLFLADNEVIAACEARGETSVTARKLERWRQAGCLPTRAVEHAVGVRGSQTANSDGYVDQVIATAELMRRRVALRLAPLALFAQGYLIDIETLRAAYADVFAQFKAVFDAASRDESHEPQDALDHADGVARAFAARVNGPVLTRWKQEARRRARGRSAESVDQIMAAALSVAFTGLIAGQAPSPEGIGEVLALAGLDGGQDRDISARFWAGVSLDRITAAIQSASLGQWVAARDDLDCLLEFARLRHSVEERVLPAGRRLTGLDIAQAGDPMHRSYLIPQQLLLADEVRASMRAGLEELQAWDRLLNALPEKFHRFVASNTESALAAKSHAFRAELASALRTWTAAHPREAVLLGL